MHVWTYLQYYTLVTKNTSTKLKTAKEWFQKQIHIQEECSYANFFNSFAVSGESTIWRIASLRIFLVFFLIDHWTYLDLHSTLECFVCFFQILNYILQFSFILTKCVFLIFKFLNPILIVIKKVRHLFSPLFVIVPHALIFNTPISSRNLINT